MLYDDTDPQHAEIDSFWNLWMLPIVFTGLAFGMLIVMAYVQFVVRRKSAFTPAPIGSGVLLQFVGKAGKP